MVELPAGLLIPNRGEIARRLVRTATSMGVRTVVAHSDIDVDLPFVTEADEAVCLGPARPAESYLNVGRIVAVALESNCDAIHPGYGFLSESPHFAQRVQDAGLTWVGPSPEVIASMGDKITARQLAADAGVPVSIGTGAPLRDVDEAVDEAVKVGYPVMLKASAGGGGIGMVKAESENELRVAFDRTRSSAERAFGSSAVFLERFLSPARHIEVQIVGLSSGEVVAIGERDCSVQRRHQKVVEESPATNLSDALRKDLLSAAAALGGRIGYQGAGTVEFLVDKKTEAFVFLEMNTRLQVEHPVTEMVSGLDLVAEQLRIACGGEASEEVLAPSHAGAAIEFRIYAEDPLRFLPSPGAIVVWREPLGMGIRVDSGYVAGNVVTPHYDPLLAKLCVWGADREEALQRSRSALDDFVIEGPRTNLEFLRVLVRDPAFVAGDYDTDIVPAVQERSRRNRKREN